MPGKQRGPGRKGIPNKDKAELRGLVQDAVLKHTTMLRDVLERKLREDPKTRNLSQEQINLILDQRQPIIEEFDPVVELAMMASDYSNKIDVRLQANSNAAQYLRPKLKTIEHLEDPEALRTLQSKQELADRLTTLLQAAVTGKSSAAPPPASVQKKPEEPEDF